MKDEERSEDQEVQQVVSRTNKNIEEVLQENVDEVINMIVEEVLQEQDVNEVLHGEDLTNVPNEGQKVVQEVVWPFDDPNPVVIRATDFHCLDEGRCITDTIVDFYLKYQERKHEWMKGLHFFSSFFFRKLVLVHQEDAANGYKKLERWMKNINIFNCDYIFLPILLSGHWSMIIICYLRSFMAKPCLLHFNSMKSTSHLDLEEHITFFLCSEWERHNNKATLKISKRELLELQIQVLEVPQQPTYNTTDCGIYLMKSVDIFLDIIAEALTLGQNSEYTLRKVNWELKNVNFQDTEANGKRMSIKQTILMLQGGSIFSSRNNIPQNTLKNEVDLSSVLKIPTSRRKPKNPERLNPHGKCLTSEEFTLNRQRAAKEEDKFNDKEEKKQKKIDIAKSKKDEKLRKQIEKQKAIELKKKETKMPKTKSTMYQEKSFICYSFIKTRHARLVADMVT